MQQIKSAARRFKALSRQINPSVAVGIILYTIYFHQEGVIAWREYDAGVILIESDKRRIMPPRTVMAACAPKVFSQK
jgi:hypothetical protein